MQAITIDVDEYKVPLDAIDEENPTIYPGTILRVEVSEMDRPLYFVANLFRNRKERRVYMTYSSFDHSFDNEYHVDTFQTGAQFIDSCLSESAYGTVDDFIKSLEVLLNERFEDTSYRVKDVEQYASMRLIKDILN